jgi:hypothetical protein
MKSQYSIFFTNGILLSACMLLGIQTFAMELQNSVHVHITNNTPYDFYYGGTQKIAPNSMATFNTQISGRRAVYHIIANIEGKGVPMQLTLDLETFMNMKPLTIQATLVRASTIMAKSNSISGISIPEYTYVISLILSGNVTNNFAGSSIHLATGVVKA